MKNNQAVTSNVAQDILHAAPVPMMLVDRHARVLNANSRAEELFSTDFFACHMEPCGVFLRCIKRHPGGCGGGPECKGCALRQAIAAVIDRGESLYNQSLEVTVDRDAGPETFHVNFGASPVWVDGVRHAVFAFYDITGWHRTDQIYKTLFNEMRYGFVLLEPASQKTPNALPDFSVASANPAIRHLFGIEPDILLGKSLRGIYPSFPENLLETFYRTLTTGEAATYETYLPLVNRHYEGTAFRPVTGQVAVIFTDVTVRKNAEEQAQVAAEEMARLLKTTEAARRDLQVANEEQKQAEQALGYEQKLLHALMENQPDRIYFKDTDCRFIKVSNMQAHVLGFSSPTDVVGKTLADIVPGAASDQAMKREREIIRTGKPLLAWVEETMGDDGKPRWHSDSKVPICGAEGVVVGLVGVTRDITPEIEMQQHLQHISKMEAVGRLAGGVAHDFNNLLQAILGFTELLLLDMDGKGRQVEDLKQIERAARRAVTLTRQLLTFSRKQQIELQALDINQVILSSKTMLKRLVGDTVETVLDLAADIHPVMADASQIEQVLINLVVNAKDAMPQGGRLTLGTATVTVQEADLMLMPEAYPGIFTCLTVSDSGCGIKSEIRPHLFDPFFTTKESGRGTGLGLSVIYGIVKQSQGWITVHSQQACGATFQVYLPTKAGAAIVAKNDAVEQDQKDVLLQGQGETILLVEDEPGVRKLARIVLQGAGYKVVACASAEEAKARFVQEGKKADLLFSDIVMAGQNGIDCALELRKEHPDLLVLLSSGYADDTVRWEAIRKEGFGFLAKPYPVVKLLRAVRETLARGRLQSGDV